ncbi:MAG: magnesium chelatase domain-containing protein, partial [Candidatus Aminicenantales bacterium]
MLVRIPSASLHGIEAYQVEVEVDISPGLPAFIIVGLPDAAVRESKERVRAALRNCGFDFPAKKIIINLAPASRKKEGSSFDLPVALGLLAFLGVVNRENLNRFLFVGELTLEGSLKSVRGALPFSLLAAEKKLEGLVLPRKNEKEACLVRNLPVYGLDHLLEVVKLLNGSD